MGLRIDRGGGGQRGPRRRRVPVVGDLGQFGSGPQGLPQLRTPTVGLAALQEAARVIGQVSAGATQEVHQEALREAERTGQELARRARETGELPSLPSLDTEAGRVVVSAYNRAVENQLSVDAKLIGLNASIEYSKAIDSGVPPEQAGQILEQAGQSMLALLSRVAPDRRDALEVDLLGRALVLEEAARKAVVEKRTGDTLVMQQNYIASATEDFAAASETAESLGERTTAAVEAIAKVETAIRQTLTLPNLTPEQRIALAAQLRTTEKQIRAQAVTDEYQQRVRGIAAPLAGETTEQTLARITDRGAEILDEVLAEQRLLNPAESDQILAQLVQLRNQERGLASDRLSQERARAAIDDERAKLAILRSDDRKAIQAAVGTLLSASEADSVLKRLDREERARLEINATIQAVNESNGSLGAIPSEQLNDAFEYQVARAGSDAANTMLEGMLRANFMPEMVKTANNRDLGSDNPEVIEAALTRITSLMQVNPGLVRDELDPRAQTVYDWSTEKMVNERVPANEVAQQAIAIGKISKQEREAREELVGRFNSAAFQERPILVESVNTMPKWARRVADTQPGMRTDWLDMVRSEVLLLPEGTALSPDVMRGVNDRVNRKFERVYGVHWDGRVMRDAPELRHGTIPVEVQQAELYSNVNALVTGPPLLEPSKPTAFLQEREQDVFAPVLSVRERETMQKRAEGSRAWFESMGVDIDKAIEDEEIFLLSDDVTRTTPNHQYAMYTLDAAGGVVVIPTFDENGVANPSVPMRWYPLGSAHWKRLETEQAKMVQRRTEQFERRTRQVEEETIVQGLIETQGAIAPIPF